MTNARMVEIERERQADLAKRYAAMTSRELVVAVQALTVQMVGMPDRWIPNHCGAIAAARREIAARR